MTAIPSILEIKIENQVDYMDDAGDPAVFATDDGAPGQAAIRNFAVVTLIGDITSVNGHPAKGTYVSRVRALRASPHPVPVPPGGAKADIARVSMREHFFEILKHDHDRTEIGTIMSTGLAGGQAPPGWGPLQNPACTDVQVAGGGGNWAIVGGTGAYLGARGQVTGTGHAGRPASMKENPGNRGDPEHLGSTNCFVLHVIPMNPPEIMHSAAGYLIFHKNYGLVTQFKPATANQDINLFATGLGPTKPDRDLSKPFPPPRPKMNSPLSVTVNDIPATNVSAVGMPGTVACYHVKFRMPAGAGMGLVPIQLSAAWISGPPATIWAG